MRPNSLCSACTLQSAPTVYVIAHCKPSIELLWLRSWHTHQARGYVSLRQTAAFIRRSKRTGFCPSHLDDSDSLCDTADARIFIKILHNPRRVLQALLPPPADRNYNLRDRLHNIQLPDCMSHLTNCNFIVWMLFCDSYWLCCFIVLLRSENCSVRETCDFDLSWTRKDTFYHRRWTLWSVYKTSMKNIYIIVIVMIFWDFV